MMKMKAYVLSLAALAGIGLATLGVVKLVHADTSRADCPGKIVCPQTGELICRDKCPTIDPDRPDCPGRILCPKTGKLVCKDRCPVTPAEATRLPCCERTK
jgi:hypothetical protein